MEMKALLQEMMDRSKTNWDDLEEEEKEVVIAIFKDASNLMFRSMTEDKTLLETEAAHVNAQIESLKSKAKRVVKEAISNTLLSYARATAFALIKTTLGLPLI